MGYTKKERQFGNGGDYGDALAADRRNLKAVRRYFGLHSMVSWATINRAVDSIKFDATEERKERRKERRKQRRKERRRQKISIRVADNFSAT